MTPSSAIRNGVFKRENCPLTRVPALHRHWNSVRIYLSRNGSGCVPTIFWSRLLEDLLSQDVARNGLLWNRRRPVAVKL